MKSCSRGTGKITHLCQNIIKSTVRTTLRSLSELLRKSEDRGLSKAIRERTDSDQL